MNYKRRVQEKVTIETGAEVNTDHIPRITSVSGTYDGTRNITKFDNVPLNQEIDFIQDVYSGYLELKREGDILSIQAGARVEYTNRRSDYSYEATDGSRIAIPDRNKFTDFFPSAHITYSFSKTHQVYLSYSRRIKRPSYWKLVPMEQYETPYSYYTGNGNVLPSYIDAYEAGYKKSWNKNFISSEFFARKTKNIMQNYYRKASKNMLVFSPENVGKSWSIGTEFMGGADIFPWWNSNLSTSLYLYRLNVDFEDIHETKKQFKTDTHWNNTFLLPKSFTLKWNFKYNSPVRNAQTKRDGFFYSNLALKKSFKDNKWTITAVYNDIFSSREYTTIQTGEDFSIATRIDSKPYFSFKLAYVLDNQN